MISRSARPKYLNLLRISLPVTGVVSIAHRISGVVLVASIPLLLYGLQLSLQDAAGFQTVTDFSTSIIGQFVSLLIFWSLLHHLIAGLRFLLLDLDIGINLGAARTSAWLVLLLSVSGTAFFAGGWL